MTDDLTQRQQILAAELEFSLSRIVSHGSHLKLHHGLLHALHIEDHLNQLLHGFGQFGLGACCGRQLLHCFLILLENRH